MSDRSGHDDRPRGVIYTVIAGPYDRLWEPLVPQRVPLVCYTDQPFESRHWELRPLAEFDDPVTCSRYYKILGHREHGASRSVYLDGNYQIAGDLWREVDGLESLRSGFTVYSVLDECVRRGKVAPERCAEAAARYRALGLPDLEIPACTVLWRRHEPEVNAFCEAWWDEFRAQPTPRDMPAFGCAAWRTGFHWTEAPWTNNDCPLAVRRNLHAGAATAFGAELPR